MSVDREEVDRIADLARLHLDEGEAERLTEEMNRILEHAEGLRVVSGRQDGESERTTLLSGMSGTRAAAANVPDPLASGIETFAPRTESGFFVVPPPHGVTADGAE
jgi:aspartyl/glutamyl-tRNA(Asn/Gln) amidotransferase C subunit